MELSGKVALVTGASQGLGRAYALALAKAGAQVVASSRSMGNPAPGQEPGENSLAKTRALSIEMGHPVHVAVCDVGSEEEIGNVVEETIGNFGRIDILVNNAASLALHYPPEFSDPMAYTTEVWQRYFQINVIGPYMLMRAVAPYMKAQRSGSIINISSSAAFLEKLDPDDLAHHNQMGYSASKAALARLSVYFATELSRWNIAVNAICPGTVITGAWGVVPADMVEAARNSGVATEASPEAVGPYIVHLAKQSGDGLSGHFLESKNFADWPAN